jgi:hypothetical protein
LILVFAGWSALVQSYVRTGTDILRYEDVLSDCKALQKLGFTSEKAWKAVIPFYPPQLISALKKSGATSDTSVNLQQVNHLVEIYLRSHSLSACGHKEVHETVGTLCSVSKGTPVYKLYSDMLTAMYKAGAIPCRTLLYCIEEEPSDWSYDEPYFFMGKRIAPSVVKVDDNDITEKRRQLIADGFQTAAHWPYEQLRNAVIKDFKGATVSEIDGALHVERGEVQMTLINNLVRPVFLLRNVNNPTYDGELQGLIPFILANIHQKLDVPELNRIRQELASGS